MITHPEWLISKVLFISIFTGVDFKDIEYEHLAEAIREVCKEQNLAAIDGQVRREIPWIEPRYGFFTFTDANSYSDPDSDPVAEVVS